MNFGQARLEEKGQIKDLWAYAFNEQEPFLSGYFDKYWSCADAVAATENGTVAGALHMQSYPLHLYGRTVSASYIEGVSVLPEMRGKGIAKGLMKQALDMEWRRGDALSILIPFSYEFYRRMGYALCYSQQYFECGAADLPSETKGYSAIRRLTAADIPEMKRLYEAFCKDKNGWLIRDSRYWEYLFFLMGIASGYFYGAFDTSGNMRGYVGFLKQKDRFKVKELVYEDGKALSGLLSFVASHFSVYNTIAFDAPAGDRLHDFLANPRCTCTIKPSFMARIVNVEQALSIVAGQEDIVLAVEDSFYEKNNGVYSLCGGKVEKSATAKPEMNLGIQQLTQLFCGFVSSYELAGLGQISMKPEQLAKLDRLFPQKKNYLYEF